MTRRIASVSLALGGLALIAALAPADQGAEKLGRLRELAEARAKVCERMLDYYRESLMAHPNPTPKTCGINPRRRYEAIGLWSRRLADAGLEAAATPDERVKILSSEVDRIKKLLSELAEMAKADESWQVTADKLEFYRLDAEYRLEKEKAGR